MRTYKTYSAASVELKHGVLRFIFFDDISHINIKRTVIPHLYFYKTRFWG